MNANNTESSIFIVVSLFLLAVIILMLVSQMIIWLTIKIKNKKPILTANIKSYELLLEKEQYDGTIKKAKLVSRFNNYDRKNNCLKLKANDFDEKNIWNCYQNLISVLVVKWKKNYKKINATLIISTLVFYLDTIMILTCALIYYINLQQETIAAIDTTVLGILSFVCLIILVLSWLVWTMTYEKVRKEIIELVDELENKELTKAIKKISGFKTLFPGSELLF